MISSPGDHNNCDSRASLRLDVPATLNSLNLSKSENTLCISLWFILCSNSLSPSLSLSAFALALALSTGTERAGLPPHRLARERAPADHGRVFQLRGKGLPPIGSALQGR